MHHRSTFRPERAVRAALPALYYLQTRTAHQPLSDGSDVMIAGCPGPASACDLTSAKWGVHINVNMQYIEFCIFCI